ncbi:uncharacterized protein HMPREF1541_08718 [Cyphellophora europaea CBS 101466]|uniref:Uncharacterized protein n=1 Tax=Cyphellophora europaea (strain CBS 101466) TaxID=1220924 RepID=W2RJD9_CYPE1|nr:uncharacterized protein HMPREF1541_08718 [Cyphellophora europaea CBS 101466]ETN36440.1 hypothetical protein HMPREF1541_08718 [Cyphellophora europaea CBS 101466]
MGNLCSKSSNEPDHFAAPGRPLGSASATGPSSAPVPQKIAKNSPGRTLGGDSSSPDDARSAAAQAAEARAAAANKPGGKLSSQLSAQRKQTQNQLLNAGSEQERRARDADQSARTQAYN